MLCGETCLQADQAFVADRQLALEARRRRMSRSSGAAPAGAGVRRDGAGGGRRLPGAGVRAATGRACAAPGAPAQAVETLRVAGVGRQQFGGGRRRRRAHVGDEVADRPVGLVADRADDRRGAGRHARATASSLKHQGLPGNRRHGPGSARRSLAGRPVAARGRSVRRPRGPALRWAPGSARPAVRGGEHADDVADHRPAGRTDDTDAARMGGQRTLAFAGEQAFAGEFSFNASKARRRAPSPARRYRRSTGSRRVPRTADLPAHLYRQPVAQAWRTRRAFCRNSAQRICALLSEGEVDMAGGQPGEVGQLALDPDLREHVFQQQAGALVQLADGQHLAIEAEPLEGSLRMGGMIRRRTGMCDQSLGFVRQILQEIFDEAFHQGLSSRRQASATSLYASASVRDMKRTAGGAMARIEAGTRATPKPASISCNWLVLRDSARARRGRNRRRGGIRRRDS